MIKFREIRKAYKRYVETFRDAENDHWKNSSAKEGMLSKKDFQKRILDLIGKYEKEKQNFLRISIEPVYEDFGDEDCRKEVFMGTDVNVEFLYDEYEKYQQRQCDIEFNYEFHKFLNLFPDKYQTVKTWTEEDLQSRGDRIWYENCLKEALNDFNAYRATA